jgi:signal transduction histidine kinase/FixJ family two-component response regulator
MKNIKDFIYREFFLKQIVWLMASLTILFAVINILQIGYGIRATKDKINTMLELNQSEIFSSIVLDDSQALKDHLALIKKQYQFDLVQIEANGETFSSAQTPVPFYSGWVKLFNPKYDAVIHNEFGTVGFKFTADFSNLTVDEYFLPYLRLSFGMFLSLLLVIYFFFKKQIGVVQKDIISPLTTLVNKLQNDELGEDVKSFNLVELDILAGAIKSYPQLKKDSVVAQISSQVAHDIRSPLEALKSAKDEISKLPEDDRRTINLAISRIEEIAYNLLMMRKKSARNTLDYTHVKSSINQVIQEKRLQYRQHDNLTFNFVTDANALSAFSGIKAETFKRIISNILTNAAEAIHFEGVVDLSLKTDGDHILIEVIDCGADLKPEHLEKMFTKGFSTKRHGNGLGLYNAKSEIEAVGGKIEITRSDKTVVSISVPLIAKPSFFISEINLSNVEKVIILDDDESIHEIWNKRFNSAGVPLEHYYQAKSLLEAYSSIPENFLLLSDYELLGEELTGIDCINRLNSAQNSILVTARADEPSIVKACEQYNLKLLPKSLANEVTIQANAKTDSIVLIDDDNFTQLSWQVQAKKKNIKIQTYFSVSEFLASANNFEKTTPIFIDSNLGDGLKGEILSEDIHKLGFTELYLATGSHPDEIQRPHWIKEVRGKEFGV